MSRLARLAALVALAAAPAAAQSPFSLVNLGQPTNLADARTEGRGGWGLAESDTLAPAYKNLAGLAGLRQVALSLSGQGESIDSRGPDGQRDNRRVMTPEIRLAVPLAGGRGAFTAGFRARRSTQYDTITPKVWLAGDDTLAVGDEQFTREGTQFAVPLGVAWRLRPGLSVGAALNLESGLIRERVNDYFVVDSDDLGGFRSARMVREDRLAGTSATLALRAEPLPGVALGATWTSAWDADVTRETETLNVVGTVDSSYTLSLPATFGAGAAVRVSPRWRVGADYEWRGLGDLRGRPDWEAHAADEWFVSFGCERERATVRRGGLANLPLRLGVATGRWGYRVGGEDVREWRVAAGTGFAFRDGGGRLDVALSYGRVGDRQRNGYEDEVWRLAVSVTGLEKW